MTDQTKKKWGAGRIPFVARLDTIRSEIAQGLPLTTIHERHRDALGVGYSAFCKLVSRHAQDAKPLRRRSSARSADATAPRQPPPPASPPAPEPAGTPNAGHPGSRRRTFDYDGNPKPDDKERLVGIKPRDPKS